jgi:DNA polymerase-3 subunit delta'
MVTAFHDVIGHAPVVALLEAELASPTQAYLFVGPANTGKAMVARRFAAALLCAGAADPSSCVRRAIQGVHPDLIAVEPDGRTVITVDQARATVSQASLAPIEGGRKVFLFEEAGLMNDEAANALLKTLEEPSPTTIFVLVAEAEDDLPATVASRTRTVVFGRVSESEVAAALGARGVDPGQAEQAARISGGRPGLATAFATRPEVADFRRVWLSVPLRLEAHPGEAYRLADDVIAAAKPLLEALQTRHGDELEAAPREGSALRLLRERQDRELKRATGSLHVTGLEILASFYRDAAAAQFGAPVRNTDIPSSAFTRVLPARALAAAGRVFAAIEALRTAQRPRLAFAALFAELAADQ